jgi:hypothetical protein
MFGLFQCCGICAIGQEEREVNRMVSAEERLIDYITFQPYDSYYPGIVALRSNGNRSLTDHFKAVSTLSTKLLKALAIFILVDFVFSLMDPTGSALGQLVVVSLFCHGFSRPLCIFLTIYILMSSLNLVATGNVWSGIFSAVPCSLALA